MFKWYKERKLRKDILYTEQYVTAQSKANELLEEARSKMLLGVICPFMLSTGKSNCRGNGCVHYNEGMARVDTFFTDIPTPDVRPPRCLLWR